MHIRLTTLEQPKPSASGFLHRLILAPQSNDEWLAWDKVEHLVLCALVTCLVYWFCKRSQKNVSHPLLAAVFAGIAVGVVKEIGDYLQVGVLCCCYLVNCKQHRCINHLVTFLQWWSGQASYKDLTADVLGSGLAALAIQAWERYSEGNGYQLISGAKQRLRFVDLELGVVYGVPIRRVILKHTPLEWLQKIRGRSA